MRMQILRKFLSVLTPLFATVLLAATASGQETVVYSFSDPNGDVLPQAGVISDANGNLYGTTFYGGTYGMGTVYELSWAASGWTETILHNFNVDGIDGFFPTGSLLFDSAGNIYGLTYEGGGVTSACRYGCGIAFELVRGQNGHWTGKVLHNFTTSSGDGQFPFGSLVFDKQGNLYGTASSGGGSSNSGIVFELSPSSGAAWSETILHNFNDSATDGASPNAGLIFDSAGNLYSTTIGGGSDGQGTVFELSLAGGGTRTETILHSFSNQAVDGYNPNGGLILDKSGNLYGVTASGGQNQDGAVFEVTP